MPALPGDDDAFDPIEASRLRQNMRATIEALFEGELQAVIGRRRYGRDAGWKGYRDGYRRREFVGTFGTETMQVLRARIREDDGRATVRCARAVPRRSGRSGGPRN